MCIGYCAIELRIILHGIYKATEAKVVAIHTGALPSKVMVVGLEVFFFLSFPPLLSFLSLYCAFTQVYVRLRAGSYAYYYLAGLLTIRLRP